MKKINKLYIKFISVFTVSMLTVVVGVMNGCGPGFNVSEDFSSLLSEDGGSSGGGTTTYVGSDFEGFMQVMNKNCVACHGASNSPFPVVSNFSNLDTVKKWIDAKLIVAKNPAESPVYYRLALGDGKGPRNMPMAFGSIANNMTQAEADAVKAFINSIELMVVEPDPGTGGGTNPTPTPTPTPTPDPGTGALGSLQCNPADRGTSQNVTNRLSKFEIRNTIAAVFSSAVLNSNGVQSALSGLLEEGNQSLGPYLDNSLENPQTIMVLAEAITASVFSQSNLSSIISGCSNSNAAACVDSLVGSTGTKIYRRPLSSSQKSQLRDIASTIGGIDGAKAVLTAMTASPYFTRHVEEGTEVAASGCAETVSTLNPGDAGTFWAPDGSAIVNQYNQTLTSSGWYVFNHSGVNIKKSVNEISLTLTVTGNVTIGINLNDQGFKSGIALSAGTHTLTYASNTYPAGSDLKFGIYVAIPSGSSIKMVSSRLNTTNTAACTSAGDRVAVSQYEIANRISYRAAGTPPDSQLLTAAQNNQLNSVSAVQSHVNRLLNSSNGRKKVVHTVESWLKKDSTSVPNTIFANTVGVNGSDLAKATKTEFDKYIEYIVFDKRGSFSDFHTDTSILPHNATMAKYFGVGQSSGAVNDGSGTYGGVIMRPATLISGYTTTSPIHRGNFIRRYVLCDHLPDPDPALVSAALDELEIDPLTQSTREITQLKTGSNACQSCHAQINPIGFPLEGIDPFGKKRSVESVFDTNGNVVATHAIDSSVSNANIDNGVVTPVSNGKDLMREIASSPKAMTCMARKVVEYTRNIKVGSQDNCMMNDVLNSISTSDSLYDVILKSIANEDILYKSSGN